LREIAVAVDFSTAGRSYPQAERLDSPARAPMEHRRPFVVVVDKRVLNAFKYKAF